MKPANTTEAKPPNRRKILVLGLGAAAFFSFFKWGSPHKKTKTIKMLSQDGKLVEVDERLLSAHKRKVTDNELQNWVNRKP